MGFYKQDGPRKQCFTSTSSFSDLSAALLGCKIDCGNPQTNSASEVIQPPLFRLPYELRRMIFWWSIALSRSPSPYQVHSTNLPTTWKDRPSPLLSTSRQIRHGVKDLLQHNQPFSLRVSTFGTAFDMLSLSSFIVQGLPKGYSGLPELRIEIWPPHHNLKRNIEMLYLHEHLQKLRNELRTGPQIRHLSVYLLENKDVKWAKNGAPRESLSDYDWCGRDDMEIVLDHFAFVTNLDKASVCLPPSLAQNEEVDLHLSFVIDRMRNGFLEDRDDIYSLVTEAELENPFATHDARSLEKWLLDELLRGYPDYKDDEPNYYWMYYRWYTDFRHYKGGYLNVFNHLYDFYYRDDEFSNW